MLIGNIEIKGLSYPVRIQYRKKQSRGKSAAGTVSVLTTDAEEIIINIKIPGRDETIANTLREYIRTTANYSRNTITLTPESNLDLGSGKGAPVVVRYWSDNFDYVKDNRNLYDFEFIFRKESI
jgi:hypothetical protein